MTKNFKLSIDFISREVNPESGEIKGVSIITEGDALGHGVKIDAATVKGVYDLVSGKTIKSYLRHDWGDRITDEIGLFSAFHIDGDKLRGTFKALRSFKNHSTKQYDTLFELASETPDNFGVSISFSARLVYFDADGEEQSYTGDEEDRVDDIFVRVLELYSVDWVGEPAANPAGVFSKKEIEEVKSKLGADVGSEELIKILMTITNKLTKLAKGTPDAETAPETITKAEPKKVTTEVTTEPEGLQEEEPETNPKIKYLEEKVAELETKFAELSKPVAEEVQEPEPVKGNTIVTDTPTETEPEVLATYHAITNRQERLNFFRANKVQLMQHL